MIRDIVESIDNPNGEWITRMEHWRMRFTKALNAYEDHSEDNREDPPEWTVEGRRPTEDETGGRVPWEEARLYALGFHPTISGPELARIMVNIDEFHMQIPIKFVDYSEVVYNYAKAGHSSQ